MTSMRKHELEPCFYIILPWDASEYYATDQQYFDVQVSTSTRKKKKKKTTTTLQVFSFVEV